MLERCNPLQLKCIRQMVMGTSLSANIDINVRLYGVHRRVEEKEALRSLLKSGFNVLEEILFSFSEVFALIMIKLLRNLFQN